MSTTSKPKPKKKSKHNCGHINKIKQQRKISSTQKKLCAFEMDVHINDVNWSCFTCEKSSSINDVYYYYCAIALCTTSWEACDTYFVIIDRDPIEKSAIKLFFTEN